MFDGNFQYFPVKYFSNLAQKSNAEIRSVMETERRQQKQLLPWSSVKRRQC